MYHHRMDTQKTDLTPDPSLPPDLAGLVTTGDTDGTDHLDHIGPALIQVPELGLLLQGIDRRTKTS